jgi:hypothetical protein
MEVENDDPAVIIANAMNEQEVLYNDIMALYSPLQTALGQNNAQMTQQYRNQWNAGNPSLGARLTMRTQNLRDIVTQYQNDPNVDVQELRERVEQLESMLEDIVNDLAHANQANQPMNGGKSKGKRKLSLSRKRKSRKQRKSRRRRN